MHTNNLYCARTLAMILSVLQNIVFSDAFLQSHDSMQKCRIICARVSVRWKYWAFICACVSLIQKLKSLMCFCTSGSWRTQLFCFPLLLFIRKLGRSNSCCLCESYKSIGSKFWEYTALLVIWFQSTWSN